MIEIKGGGDDACMQPSNLWCGEVRRSVCAFSLGLRYSRCIPDYEERPQWVRDSARAGFTGSDTLTRQGLTRRILVTQGVMFLAENAQAHWLTDLIVAHHADPRVR